MWLFKRKKAKELPTALPCPHCGSAQTAPKAVKGWRGERYVSYRCAACGRDFYGDEPPEGLPDPEEGPAIEDEDALRKAEEELKRRADEDGDHTFPSGDG
jgi:DNA-directed RNA polymerase subunit RPC12/RpoP